MIKECPECGSKELTKRMTNMTIDYTYDEYNPIEDNEIDRDEKTTYNTETIWFCPNCGEDLTDLIEGR